MAQRETYTDASGGSVWHNLGGLWRQLAQLEPDSDVHYPVEKQFANPDALATLVMLGNHPIFVSEKANGLERQGQYIGEMSRIWGWHGRLISTLEAWVAVDGSPSRPYQSPGRTAFERPYLYLSADCYSEERGTAGRCEVFAAPVVFDVRSRGFFLEEALIGDFNEEDGIAPEAAVALDAVVHAVRGILPAVDVR